MEIQIMCKIMKTKVVVIMPALTALYSKMAQRGGIIMVVLFLMFLPIGLNSASASPYTEIIVFGDSLTDTGNRACDFWKYHAPPYYDCRYSNGPVWIEYLAENLDLPIPIASENGGTNYAYGGATSGAIRYLTPSYDMDVQMQYYLNNHSARSDQLFVIWIGTNDFNAGQTDPTASVNMTISHITTLVMAGAKNFLVVNLSFHQFYNMPFFSPSLEPLIDQFNNELSEGLSELRIGFDNLSIYELDYSSLVDAILLDPEEFGLLNVTDPACADCGYGFSTYVPVDIVSNPEEYFFWDDIHLSTSFHQILGKAAFDILPKYGGGSGTEEDPYQIWTPEHLNTIGLASCDWDKCFVLMADIDISEYTGMQFNIINRFTGVFDGNHYTISNLTWNSTEMDYIGIFRHLVYSSDPNMPTEIRNVELTNAMVDAGTGNCIGSLVGYNEGGRIINCSASVDIMGNNEVGGLAGRSRGIGSYGEIKDCHSVGSVYGNDYVGGLVGNNMGDINCCYSNGFVSGKNIVGGLVGNNNDSGSINNCYVNGNVEGIDNIGGIVGSNLGWISVCHSSNHIVGESSFGGIVGINKLDSGPYGDIYEGVLCACYWDAETSCVTNMCGIDESGYCDNSNGKTTFEMMQQSTFGDGWLPGVNWDFINIWNIGENQTYPYLRTYSASDINKDKIVNLIDLSILAGQWMEDK